MADILYGRFGAAETYSSDPAFGIMAKVYSARYLKALYDRPRAFERLINFSGDIKGKGSSVFVPVFPRIAPVDVSGTDGTITDTASSITHVELVCNYYKASKLDVPDSVMRASQLPDLFGALADNQARSLVDSIDHAITADIFPTITTNSVGTAGAGLLEDVVYQAFGKLIANHVDPSLNPDEFVWILPSSSYHKVMGLKGYTSYRILPGDSTQGGQDVKPQQLTLLGVDVHFRSDSEMSVTGGYVGGLFHRDSVGVAFQQMPSLWPVINVPGTVNWELKSTALFGIKTLKEYLACLVYV